MKKKVIIGLSVLLSVSALWISRLIPMQIARISAEMWVKNNLPEKHLEYSDVEWNKFYGDYVITFKDDDGKIYSAVIGPEFLPVSMGQGIEGWE